MSLRLRRVTSQLSCLLSLFAVAGCSAASSSPESTTSSSAAATATTQYPDADYDEGFDLDPGGAPLAGADPNATTTWNETDDPQRPPQMPKNFLYVRNTCGPTACSNMYDLYAQPDYLSPRWAFRNGCIADPTDFQGGTSYGNIESFLEAQLSGTTWTGEGTDVTGPVDAAGNAVASPDYAWGIVTALIDAHKPFVVGVSWDDTPSTDTVGHVLSVVDYAVHADGLKYVLLMNFGHYKWYPWLDQGPTEFGFKTRWSVNDSGTTYYRIYPDAPISDATWATWHSQ